MNQVRGDLIKSLQMARHVIERNWFKLFPHFVHSSNRLIYAVTHRIVRTMQVSMVAAVHRRTPKSLVATEYIRSRAPGDAVAPARY